MKGGTGENAVYYYYLYDGRGNVSAVMKESDESVAAAYRYDGFGNVVGLTGTLDQPFRFSTKYHYPGLGLGYEISWL